MLTTNPHQDVYKQNHVYLWGRYSLCFASLSQFPVIQIRIPIGVCSETWFFFQRGMWRAEIWGSHLKVKKQQGHDTHIKPMVCTRECLCSAVCSLEHKLPWFCSQLSEFYNFVLNSHWIKLKNNPTFVIHQSTTKLQYYLVFYITSMPIFLYSCGCTVSQTPVTGQEEPYLPLSDGQCL